MPILRIHHTCVLHVPDFAAVFALVEVHHCPGPDDLRVHHLLRPLLSRIIRLLHQLLRHVWDDALRSAGGDLPLRRAVLHRPVQILHPLACVRI